MNRQQIILNKLAKTKVHVKLAKSVPDMTSEIRGLTFEAKEIVNRLMNVTVELDNLIQELSDWENKSDSAIDEADEIINTLVDLGLGNMPGEANNLFETRDNFVRQIKDKISANSIENASNELLDIAGDVDFNIGGY